MLSSTAMLSSMGSRVMLGLRLPRGVRPQSVLGPSPGSSFMSLGCGPSHRIGVGVLEWSAVLSRLMLDLLCGFSFGSRLMPDSKLLPGLANGLSRRIGAGVLECTKLLIELSLELLLGLSFLLLGLLLLL